MESGGLGVSKVSQWSNQMYFIKLLILVRYFINYDLLFGTNMYLQTKFFLVYDFLPVPWL